MSLKSLLIKVRVFSKGRSISNAKRPLYILNLIALLDFFAVSLFLPLINREIRTMGGSPFIMGLVTSAYGAIQLISSPIFGHGADVYGRKPTVLVSVLAATIAYISLGSATSLLMVLVSRILAGFFKHTQTLSKLILTDLEPMQKSYVLGNFNAFGSMGFIVGPTIGTHLVGSENGFRNVCYLAAIIFIINAVLIQFVIPETLSKPLHDHGHGRSEEKPRRSGEWSYGKSETMEMGKSTIFMLLVLRFLFSFATIVPRSNLFLIMEAKYQASIVSVGYLDSLQATVATATGFLVGPVIERLYKEDSRKLVIHYSIAQCVSLFSLFFSPTFQIAGLSLMLLSASNAFLRVGITSLSLIDEKDHGAILGLGQTATSLSRMLAPLMAGIAQQGFSEDGPAIIAAASSLFGVACVVFCVPRPTLPSISLTDKKESSKFLL